MKAHVWIKNPAYNFSIGAILKFISLGHLGYSIVSLSANQLFRA